MYSYEHIPTAWFTSTVRRRRPPPPPPYCSSQMSKSVSKSFNRISDFIFPDTIHIHCSPLLREQQQQQQQTDRRRYERTENYSLPVLNQKHRYQPDLIILERLPADELENIDFLYREQTHQVNRPVRRRHSSIIDERRAPSNEKMSSGIVTRPAAFREKIRDRRKRHTTDNIYHSMLKSMLETDEQPNDTNAKNSNYILSYRTTLDPITDSESMTSLHERAEQQVNDNISHCRVPINGTVPIMTEHERTRQRQHSSTISSRDSSSDTDIAERQSLAMNYTHNQHSSQDVNAGNASRTLREHRLHQSNGFIPMTSSTVNTNNHRTTSYSNNRTSSSPFDNVNNYQRNNQTSPSKDSNHVSICVNDLHTTLFIDEDTLNNTKMSINANSNGGKAHVRKRNTLVNGSIITTNYHSRSEIIKRKTDTYSPWINTDENKYVRPYFLIKPQSVLMLPDETAKFKCCFGGDPLPNIIWAHNNFHVPEKVPPNGIKPVRYRVHKLHDIYYLDIEPINLRDNGQIKCTITNKFGSEEAVVQLYVVPSPADATPCITQSLCDMIVLEGRPLELLCGIKGLQVTVNWFHNGKLISSTAEAKDDYNEENTIFTLSCCMRTDAGTVDCLVKNRFGEARTSCRIEVVHDPEFDR